MFQDVKNEVVFFSLSVLTAERNEKKISKTTALYTLSLSIIYFFLSPFL